MSHARKRELDNGDDDHGTEVCFGNIACSLSADDLKQLCQSAGLEVLTCRIHTTTHLFKTSGMPDSMLSARSYGFATFTTEDEARRAIRTLRNAQMGDSAKHTTVSVGSDDDSVGM